MFPIDDAGADVGGDDAENGGRSTATTPLPVIEIVSFL